MVANTFVTKFTEECGKCNDFITRSAIKTLQFEEDVVASHQIMGSLFKDDVPEVIIEMLKSHCLSLLF